MDLFTATDDCQTIFILVLQILSETSFLTAYESSGSSNSRYCVSLVRTVSQKSHVGPQSLLSRLLEAGDTYILQPLSLIYILEDPDLRLVEVNFIVQLQPFCAPHFVNQIEDLPKHEVGDISGGFCNLESTTEKRNVRWALGFGSETTGIQVVMKSNGRKHCMDRETKLIPSSNRITTTVLVGPVQVSYGSCRCPLLRTLLGQMPWLHGMPRGHCVYPDLLCG